MARSRRRPGVLTTTADSAAQRLDLRLVGPPAIDRQDPHATVGAGPPEVGGHLTASSRVGPPRVPGEGPGSGIRLLPGTATRWRIGMPNPSVLPVPVLARPMMSWPARATGRVGLDRGGVVMPAWRGPSRSGDGRRTGEGLLGHETRPIASDRARRRSGGRSRSEVSAGDRGVCRVLAYAACSPVGSPPRRAVKQFRVDGPTGHRMSRSILAR